MEKRVLAILLSLSIASSILVSIFRWRIEADNRTVEIACDYNELFRLCLQWGYPLDTFLCRLKESGINSIAFEEDTLNGLSSEGRLTLIKGEEVKKLQYLAPVQSIFPRDSPTQDIENYTFLMTSDFALGERIRGILAEKLGQKRVKTVEENWHEKPLMVLSLYAVDEREISQLGIGFSTEKIEGIANYGLKSVLVMTNGPLINEASIQAVFSTVSDWGNISAVVFSGDTILGYPEFLNSVREQLERKQVKSGIAEFLNQDGLSEVTKNLYQRIIRVHSISTEELGAIRGEGRLKVPRLISRFLRAVRERNVRLLYIRLPFISVSNDNLQIQSNLDYIKGIKMSLLENNFKVGFSQPFKPFPAFLNLIRFPIFLMVLILPLWAIYLYRSFSLSFFYLYLFTCLALVLLFWREVIFIQVVCLIAALSFPLLALFIGLFVPESSALRTRKQRDLLLTFWLFLKVTVTTIFGGILIACLLSRLDFILQVHQFRGVKISFILPLIMGLFLLSGWSEQSFEEGGLSRFHVVKVSEFLSRKVEFGDLLIFSILALAGIVLLLRSGNYYGPFLLEIEHRAREILEKLLIIRPRIKEFLIGHPLMILGMYLHLRGKSRKEEELRLRTISWRLLIILGLIGQVSIINSFCHAHTPLVISLARTINGIWLGIIVGFLLVAIPQKIEK